MRYIIRFLDGRLQLVLVGETYTFVATLQHIALVRQKINEWIGWKVDHFFRKKSEYCNKKRLETFGVLSVHKYIPWEIQKN